MVNCSGVGVRYCTLRRVHNSERGNQGKRKPCNRILPSCSWNYLHKCSYCILHLHIQQIQKKSITSILTQPTAKLMDRLPKLLFLHLCTLGGNVYIVNHFATDCDSHNISPQDQFTDAEDSSSVNRGAAPNIVSRRCGHLYIYAPTCTKSADEKVATDQTLILPSFR